MKDFGKLLIKIAYYDYTTSQGQERLKKAKNRSIKPDINDAEYRMLPKPSVTSTAIEKYKPPVETGKARRRFQTPNFDASAVKERLRNLKVDTTKLDDVIKNLNKTKKIDKILNRTYLGILALGGVGIAGSILHSKLKKRAIKGRKAIRGNM